jgi:iron complex transport system substrate-binding protein
MRYTSYLFVFFILLIVSCTNRIDEKAVFQTIEVNDDLGRTIVVPLKPRRVVSLTPSITELLYTFSDTAILVGRSIWCDYPERVKKIPAINNYPVDIEGLVRLQPDLVFAKKGMITLQEIQKLDQLKIPIIVYAFDKMSEINLNTKRLIALTHGDTVKMYTWLCRLQIDSVVSAKRRSIAVVSVLPICVYGKQTFLSELMESTGGVNVIGATANAYPTVDVEYVLRSNPEQFIFGSIQQQQDFFDTYPILKTCDGYKSQKLFIIDDSVLSRPGIRLPLLRDSLISIMQQ